MTLIVDAHEDIAWNVLCFGRDYLRSAYDIREVEAGGSVEAATGVAMLGLPEWLAGQVAVIFGTLFTLPERKRTNPTESHYSTPGEAYTLAMRQIDIYEHLARQSAQIRLIQTRPDLEAVLKSWEGSDPPPASPDESNGRDHRQVGVVYLMEGGDAIQQPEEIAQWYERGLRIVGPAWAATRYCGGTSEPGPLTDEGVRLLKGMADYHMVLDTSHMAEQAFFQALDQYDGPIIASHSNPRALSDDSDRHLSDAMIDALLGRGAVIGTVLYNKFLLRGWNQGDRLRVPARGRCAARGDRHGHRRRLWHAVDAGRLRYHRRLAEDHSGAGRVGLHGNGYGVDHGRELAADAKEFIAGVKQGEH